MSTSIGKILFVDDDESFRTFMSDLLSSLGFDAISACSRAEALLLMKEENISLVLTDLVMETQECGLRLCEDVANLHPMIPVILITGFPSFVAATLAASVGAFDFLVKPFLINDLYEVIKMAWK